MIKIFKDDFTNIPSLQNRINNFLLDKEIGFVKAMQSERENSITISIFYEIINK